MNLIFVNTGVKNNNTYFKVLDLINNAINSIGFKTNIIYTDNVPQSGYDAICICPPVKFKDINNIKYCYTMHETPLISNGFFDGINDKIETIICPSKYVATIFASNGFKNRIIITPLYPSSVFKYQPPISKDEFVFLCGGILENGYARKDISVIVDAFQLAFMGIKDVRLYIKTNKLSIPVDSNDKRIVTINKYIKEKMLHSLYAYSDCYVNLATGGFELMPLEALATGRIVISHNYGGVSEYLTHENCIFLDYHLENCNDGIWHGLIARVSPEELAEKMFHVYKNRDYYRANSEKYSLSVSNFNATNTGVALLDNIHSLNRKKEQIFFKSSNDYSVVITSCRRPDKLKIALESCVKNKIKNVVVSLSCATGQDLGVVRAFYDKIPNLICTYIDNDYGNNENWLRGLNAVKTDWTLLLHDDDFISADDCTICSYIDRLRSFLVWTPQVVGGVNSILKFFDTTGYLDTSEIYKLLLNNDAYSISPGAGLFKTKDLVDVLKECEIVMTNDENYYYRDKMIAGNDLLIWLRMADKYKSFRYVNHPITTFLHWDGSITVEDISKKQYKLARIYNYTRDYYLYGNYKFKFHIMPRICYVYNSDYPDVRQDIGLCLKYISELFNGKIEMCGVSTDECDIYVRDCIKTPYIKSLIDTSIKKYNIKDSDYIIFANNDVYPVKSFYEYIRYLFSFHGQYVPIYCFRRNVHRNKINCNEIEIRIDSNEYPGRDLFGMPAYLWTDIRDEMDGFVNGAEGWDVVLSFLLEFNGAIPLQYLIYHPEHDFNKTRIDSSLNSKTNRLMIDFLNKNHIKLPSISPHDIEGYNIIYPKKI